MEHLVRVQNEADRQTLAWLRQRVGDAALSAAAQACGGSSKPWLSVVCRRLGVTPPVVGVRSAHRVPGASGRGEVAERHLAAMRAMLARPPMRRVG